MKNYENRLKAIKRLADSKTAKVAFLDFRNGKYYQGGKQVDISTVKANVIIIDDISSRGGTFYHSAKKLKELGANKIYLYITHCEKTILEGEIFSSGLIEKVYTTNSIFFNEAQSLAESKGVANKIEVIRL